MTAIAHNPIGLQVCDLIAQLQLQPANDYTNISSVEREPGTVIGAVQLRDNRVAMIEEWEDARDTARARALDKQRELDRLTAQHAALLKHAASARAIMLRIKKLKAQRPPCLP